MKIMNKLNKQVLFQASQIFTKSKPTFFSFNCLNFHSKAFTKSFYSFNKYYFADLPSHIKLRMPTLSPTMTKVT